VSFSLRNTKRLEGKRESTYTNPRRGGDPRKLNEVLHLADSVKCCLACILSVDIQDNQLFSVTLNWTLWTGLYLWMLAECVIYEHIDMYPHNSQSSELLCKLACTTLFKMCCSNSMLLLLMPLWCQRPDGGTEEAGWRGQGQVHWSIGSICVDNPESTCCPPHNSCADGMVPVDAWHRERNSAYMQVHLFRMFIFLVGLLGNI